MPKPKHIGLIGGLSPESTLEYYKIITQGYNEKFGGLNFPEITIRSINLAEIANAQNNNDWDKVADIIVGGICDLQRAGADFAAICSNTPHNAYELIRRKSSLDVLSIMEATANEINEDCLETVGLLGTKQTMEYGYFQKTFGQYGIKTIIPDEKEREFVNNVIWTELVHGKITSASRQGYISVIRNMIKQEAEGIVLGCTEIPLLIKQEDCPVKIYDTTEIHANAILKYAVEGM